MLEEGALPDSITLALASSAVGSCMLLLLLLLNAAVDAAAADDQGASGVRRRRGFWWSLVIALGGPTPQQNYCRTFKSRKLVHLSLDRCPSHIFAEDAANCCAIPGRR